MTDDPAAPVPVHDEVRTRRLVVTDEAGSPRVVAEVVDGTAEVRVGLPDDDTHPPHVLVYAVPRGGDGLGPHIGVQLWADGDAYAEMNLSRVDDRWVAEVRTLPDPS